MQKGDIGSAVGIIFDRGYPGGDPVFVSFEINDPVFALVASSPMPNGNTALRVSSSAFLKGPKKAFFGPLPCYLLEGDFRRYQRLKR